MQSRTLQLASSRPIVVLANGCFDPFHYGHLLHLEEASRMGDVLVVSVTEDEFVNKGPNRPVFPLAERMAVLEALRCVDQVIPAKDGFSAIKSVNPDIFVKDQEYEGKVDQQSVAYCRERGIKIAFTRQKRYSSTNLLKHYAN